MPRFQADDRRGTGRRPGFTLVELLIILGIVGILFAVTLVAVDPSRRFAEARDSDRRIAVRSVLEGILTYLTDNRGNYPSAIDSLTASVQIIGTNGSACDGLTCQGYASTMIAAACANLTSSLVETYLAQVPYDPKTGSLGNSRYYVNKTSGGRIEVGTCDAEQVASINVRR